MTRWMLWLCLAALSGCAVGFQKQGRVIDPADVARLRVGESTKQDVLDLFGPPTQLSRAVGVDESGLFQSDEPTWIYDTKQDLFRYEYTENRELFFSLLLYTYWDRQSLSDTLLVMFDQDAKVQYVAFTKETDAQPEHKHQGQGGGD